jgi:hypothetical protein
MKPEDVKKLYLEYQSLQGLSCLKDIHNELGNSLPFFIQAYKKISQSGISIYRVIGATQSLQQIPQIENQYKELCDTVNPLPAKVQCYGRDK